MDTPTPATEETKPEVLFTMDPPKSEAPAAIPFPSGEPAACDDNHDIRDDEAPKAAPVDPAQVGVKALAAKRARLMMVPNAPATIMMEAPGKEPLIFECMRNVLTMGEALNEKLKDFEKPDEVQITISTLAVNIDTKERVPMGIAAGNIQTVAGQLGAAFIPADRAIHILSQVLNDLCECSALKTLMVIGVFGDGGKNGGPGVGGFTAINGRLSISGGEAIMHAAAIEGELERFKGGMRKQGVQFPGDSAIIIPGEQGFSIPAKLPGAAQ